MRNTRTAPVRSGIPSAAVASGLGVAVASAVANLASYALVMVLARSLSTVDFSSVGALLNLAVIATVPALALQLVVARHAALAGRSGPSALRAAWSTTRRTTEVIAASVCGALLLSTPLIVSWLKLHRTSAAVLLAFLMVPVAFGFAAQGWLQGRRSFRLLAWAMVAAALGRTLGAAGGAWWGQSDSTVIAGATIGSLIGALLGWGLALRRVTPRSGPGTSSDTGSDTGGDTGGDTGSEMRHSAATIRAWLGEVLGAGFATAGVLALANLDVLIARSVLDAQTAALAVIGSYIAKAAFWGPQFVATLAYPRLVHSDRRESVLRVTAALTLGFGAAAASVAALFGRPLARLIGGGRYDDAAPVLWQFALLGTLLAVLHLVVTARLARADRWIGVPLWLGVAFVIFAAWWWRPGSISAVVALLAGVTTAVLIIAWWRDQER